MPTITNQNNHINQPKVDGKDSNVINNKHAHISSQKIYLFDLSQIFPNLLKKYSIHTQYLKWLLSFFCKGLFFMSMFVWTVTFVFGNFSLLIAVLSFFLFIIVNFVVWFFAELLLKKNEK